MLCGPGLSRRDSEQVIAPGKYPRVRQNLRIRICLQWLQTDVQEPIAGLPLHGFVRIRLRGKRFAQQIQIQD